MAIVRSAGPSMPRYSERMLPDADVADIAAYLKLFPPARKVTDIPSSAGADPLTGPGRPGPFPLIR